MEGIPEAAPEGTRRYGLFTVPTLSFQVLYVLVVLHHHRRRVIHFAVTVVPSAEWIRQQLREAFPYDTAPRFLICDRDGLFDASVLNFMQALRITPVRTAPHSPWQTERSSAGSDP